LVKARAKFKAAVKDAKNPHFKSAYVSLDGVVDAVTDALLSHNIFPTQQTDIQDGRTVLHTRFLHTSGQWIGSVYPVHPVKSDPQGEGSALTYARRYALMALAGIAPEDDDGNAAVSAVERDNAKEAALTQEWIEVISAADSIESLEAIASDVAKAGLSASAKARVRAAYSATKNALTPKAAA